VTRADGFSLIELLVALTVCGLLAATIAAAAPPARALFDATPEVLDLQQRERTAADVLAYALRSAARLAATRANGTAGEIGPAIEFLEPNEDGVRFHSVRVLVASGAGRGVLLADQVSPASALVLRSGSYCPATGDACGFSKGGTAAIVDVEGRVDVFVVASVNKGARSLTPARALARAYPVGSALMSVSADTYYLDAEDDGSFTLVRETAAGAVQPIVDAVVDVDMLPVWRAGVLTRVDLVLRMRARSLLPRRVVPGRTQRLSVSLRNPS
jgi:prepilin-type N-terminal cleavage/methylation domain-containing protein